jgi:DNA-binding CsgD family transcriptional regulator
LSENGARAPIVVAIEVDEPGLAAQLAALLRRVPGLRLANDGEQADVTMIASLSPSGESDTALTPRELEVLALVAEGASNKTIARRLGISVHTAKFHVGSLLDKLDATGRTDAVAAAARLGLIHL